jgi:hypothetical protein
VPGKVLVVQPAVIEQQLEVHIQDAGDVIRPLDVAAQPVRRGKAGNFATRESMM